MRCAEVALYRLPSRHFGCRMPPPHFGCRVPPPHFWTLHQWWLKFLATILYPFLGQMYQIVIFGSKVAKMGRKFWRETQNTLSRWKIWKFDQSSRTLKCPIPESGRTPVKKTDSWFLVRERSKWVKNPGGKLSGPLTYRSESSPGQNFENLTHGRTPKELNPGFDHERVFRFGTLHQWCLKFFPRIF